MVSSKIRSREQSEQLPKLGELFHDITPPNWNSISHVTSFCLKSDLLVIFYCILNQQTYSFALTVMPLSKSCELQGFEIQNYVELLDLEQNSYKIVDPICQMLPCSKLLFTAAILVFDDESEQAQEDGEDQEQGAQVTHANTRLMLGACAYDREENYIWKIYVDSYEIPFNLLVTLPKNRLQSINFTSRTRFVQCRQRIVSLTLLTSFKPLVLIHCWHKRKFQPVGSNINYPGLQLIGSFPSTSLLFAMNDHSHLFACTLKEGSPPGTRTYCVSRLYLTF